RVLALLAPVPFLALLAPVPFLALLAPVPFLALLAPVSFLALLAPVPFLALLAPVSFALETLDFFGAGPDFLGSDSDMVFFKLRGRGAQVKTRLPLRPAGGAPPVPSQARPPEAPRTASLRYCFIMSYGIAKLSP
ncbi:MAG: hypothetical protein CMJ89_12780, partial [Planctomycetes bacterium]|nr:hypothetical protein [Planctomycetota bacterium]